MVKVKTASLLLALLLASTAVPNVAAQTGGAGASAAPPSEPPPPLARRPRAYTGVDIRFSGTGDANGVITPNYPVVRAVHPDSPGQQAGLAAGDVIMEVNGTDAREQRALWLQAGVRYTLRIRNGDQEREVVLVPVVPPEAPATGAP